MGSKLFVSVGPPRPTLRCTEHAINVLVKLEEERFRLGDVLSKCSSTTQKKAPEQSLFWQDVWSRHQ